MERKVGECSQWKAIGQCSKGDSCCFSHGNNRGQPAQTSSLAPRSQTLIDGKRPSKGGSSPSGKRVQRPCKNYLKRNCTNQSCDQWHLPVCQNYKSESGCKYGDKCRFRHNEVDGQQSKKSKKGAGKGSVACRSPYNWVACLKILIREGSIQRKEGKLGSKSHRQIPQRHVEPHQKSGKKGSIARRHSKA